MPTNVSGAHVHNASLSAPIVTLEKTLKGGNHENCLCSNYVPCVGSRIRDRLHARCIECNPVWKSDGRKCTLVGLRNNNDLRVSRVSCFRQSVSVR